ncbi:hypothetical protein H696_01953 [Fonticula alba]|uniref:tRNA pseudouridine(55) synthase n=1 Tax=Fonticula alba TaxID=691883 RepID=A0A058ZAQ9_FONAL|nr:hypothetical protein H696_01953 [Fonticula alba]KCV71008.1 hypothetical protein H696_01953 [Fonticula alba]|eukprot:XP_009494131.1 hypothetical protein H696_01953 [Fonticula alba]
MNVSCLRLGSRVGRPAFLPARALSAVSVGARSYSSTGVMATRAEAAAADDDDDDDELAHPALTPLDEVPAVKCQLVKQALELIKSPNLLVAPSPDRAPRNGLFSLWKPPGLTSFYCLEVMGRSLASDLIRRIEAGEFPPAGGSPSAKGSSPAGRPPEEEETMPAHLAARKVARGLRVGHGGTLDPLASGVLVVGVGREGCRNLTGALTEHRKSYVARLRLGVSTSTSDRDGAALWGSAMHSASDEQPPEGDAFTGPFSRASLIRRFGTANLAALPVGILQAALREHIAALVGDHLQTPPIQSAKQRNGLRLYQTFRYLLEHGHIDRALLQEHHEELILSKKRPVTLAKINRDNRVVRRKLALAGFDSPATLDYLGATFLSFALGEPQPRPDADLARAFAERPLDVELLGPESGPHSKTTAAGSAQQVDHRDIFQMAGSYLPETSQVTLFGATVLDAPSPVLPAPGPGGESLDQQGLTLASPSATLNLEHCLDVDIDIHCSSGFYVRSLIESVGRSLGCGAHMVQLCRTSQGPFDQRVSLDLANLKWKDLDRFL